MSGDTWDPEKYARFAAERSRPFFDLLDLVTPIPGGRAVDLGCGPGELTRASGPWLEYEGYGTFGQIVSSWC